MAAKELQQCAPHASHCCKAHLQAQAQPVPTRQQSIVFTQAQHTQLGVITAQTAHICCGCIQSQRHCSIQGSVKAPLGLVSAQEHRSPIAC